MALLLLALLAAAPDAAGSRPLAPAAAADVPVKEAAGQRAPAGHALAVVAVGADPSGKAAAPQLQWLATSAAARSRFQPVDLVEALDPERAAARQKGRAEAEAALAEAEKAYNDLDTQRAAKLADAAAKAFARADLSRTWAGYVRARVLKVACLAANGQVRPARAELERLLAVAPDVELPPSQFAPDLLAFARRARQSALSRDAKLEVRTTPEGAEVWVDGQRRGLSPLTVRGLGPGEHHLTVRAVGAALHQQLASGEVSIPLEPAARQASWAQVERAAADRGAAARAAAALGAGAGAEQVLLAIASRADRPDALALELVRLDAEGARVRAEVRGTVPQGEAMGEAAAALLDRALGPDAVALVPKEAPPAAGPAFLGPPGAPFTWTRTHTGLGLMGGGAVLAGAGGFFGYQALVKRDQLRATAQTDPASQQLRARGQLYALLADALFASALAAGAAGGYLAFFAAGPGPEPR